MTTNTEHYAGTFSESSNNLNNGMEGETKYNEITPWRMIISGSYLFNAVEKCKKRKADFITADIEYVNYRGSRFLCNFRWQWFYRPKCTKLL